MEVNEAAPKYYPKLSPFEFLEWERKQEYKHEYVNGEIFAMAGASFTHNLILSNIISLIRPRLRGTSCNIFPSDLRIAVKSKDSFFYPDATIVCGPPQFDDDGIKDTVKNPTVIFEILSPSNEDYDIGKKLMYYMQIESLKQYIIIDSRTIHLRAITKKEEGTWKFSELTSPEEKLFIEAIGLDVDVKDFYEDVKF